VPLHLLSARLVRFHQVHGTVFGINEQTSAPIWEADAVYLCQEWKLHLRARKEVELEKGYLALATALLYHLKGRWKSSGTVKIYVKQELCQYKRFYNVSPLLKSQI
jgi:hypothetical protein